jgi:hypothetical protein
VISGKSLLTHCDSYSGTSTVVVSELVVAIAHLAAAVMAAVVVVVAY